jgi:hypothetical protein
MAVKTQERSKTDIDEARVMLTSRGINVHLKQARDAVKNATKIEVLGIAKNQFLAAVPHLENAKKYGGRIEDLASDVERAIVEYNKAIDQGLFTKPKQLFEQMEKDFKRKKTLLIALVEIEEEKQKKAA